MKAILINVHAETEETKDLETKIKGLVPDGTIDIYSVDMDDMQSFGHDTYCETCKKTTRFRITDMFRSDDYFFIESSCDICESDMDIKKWL